MDRSKKIEDDGWTAVPIVVGLVVGAAMVLIGFFVWKRAEGFEICKMSRREREMLNLMENTGQVKTQGDAQEI